MSRARWPLQSESPASSLGAFGRPGGTERPQAQGGGLPGPGPASPPQPAPPAQIPDGGATVGPGRGDMPELVVTALLAPSRLTLKLLRAFMWSLVFSAALVAAAGYGCIALAHVLCRPRRGCCGRPRRAPPACLSDPALGEHCFLTLRVSTRGRSLGLGGGTCGPGAGSGEQMFESKPGSAHSWEFKPTEEGFPHSQTVPSLPQSSGLRLHYVSAGRGNGPLMLFLHGFPETWYV